MPETSSTVGSPSASVPVLLRLTVERFRGIERLNWYPSASVNIILGGGDTGKTTILEAIALLLSPTNTTVLSDTDFLKRAYDTEFSIEGVFSLPDTCGINGQPNQAWPWEWDGREASIPVLSEDAALASPTGQTVYRLRVRGTAEMELVYEILQPDGTCVPLSVRLRRAMGLVRLSGEDRNDRDLRLVQGSALDRLLSDQSLRSRLANRLGECDVQQELSEEARETLAKLDETFKGEALPHDLNVGITGGQGFSVGALIGLTAKQAEIDLPLSCWGSGTRRLAALAIAEQHSTGSPLMLVDEIERGLEPYRQRALVRKLEQAGAQVFLTTHSTSVLASAEAANIWYLDTKGNIGLLDGDKIADHRAKAPEAFLSKLTIVAEGITEVGFVTYLLEKALGTSLETHGIYVADGGGNETTVKLLQALADGGLAFGGFADNEGTFSGTWESLQQKLGKLLFRWAHGCLEKNVFAALPPTGLEKLVEDPDGVKGPRLRTLAERLTIERKDWEAIKTAVGDNLLQLLCEAATGFVPEDKKGDKEEKKRLKSHGKSWFKSYEGGRELAEKAIALGAWPAISGDLLPFLNAVRKAVGLPEIEALPT